MQRRRRFGAPPEQERGHRQAHSHCSPSFNLSDYPITPPRQQTVVAEPCAPRKRRVPHHEDLTIIDPPSQKRARANYGRMPYINMDVHFTSSGDPIAISPTGTICRCHLRPGSICTHQVYEPHVSDAMARAEYEQLSPIKQVLERRRVNKMKEKANELEELELDAKVVTKEGQDWLHREKMREKLAAQRTAVGPDGKWVYVARGYDDGFVEDDDEEEEDEDSDKSEQEQNYGESNDCDSEEDLEDDGETESEEDEDDEDQDNDSEYDDEDSEGENNDDNSFSDDEEVPPPKRERTRSSIGTTR